MEMSIKHPLLFSKFIQRFGLAEEEREDDTEEDSTPLFWLPDQMSLDYVIYERL